MKRFFSFLALLCLFFKVAAQENINNKGIKIGEPVPDVQVNSVSGLRINGREVSAFHVSELRGKLLILEPSGMLPAVAVMIERACRTLSDKINVPGDVSIPEQVIFFWKRPPDDEFLKAVAKGPG